MIWWVYDCLRRKIVQRWERECVRENDACTYGTWSRKTYWSSCRSNRPAILTSRYEMNTSFPEVFQSFLNLRALRITQTIHVPLSKGKTRYDEFGLPRTFCPLFLGENRNGRFPRSASEVLDMGLDLKGSNVYGINESRPLRVLKTKTVSYDFARSKLTPAGAAPRRVSNPEGENRNEGTWFLEYFLLVVTTTLRNIYSLTNALIWFVVKNVFTLNF